MNGPILGLDLAENLGISVIDAQTNKLLFSDSRKLSSGDPQRRLLNLRALLIEVIDKYKPVEIAIEDVFLPAKTSRKTPISLGELRGVARLSAAERNLPVFFYAPRQIKQAVTGYGNAKKEDIVHWIQSEFAIKVRDDNEADAISIAWTHILMRRFNLIQKQG
ncbi:MAG: crossover junction endodeoxyribonuclease RuvC [Candidatus Rifleibacteriota bacterium]